LEELKLDRKTRYTRMVLQDSLIELMKEKPISKITIKELCEKADINRSTFYAHYTDLYDLLHKVESETLSWAKEAVANLMGKPERQEALKILEGIFQNLIENSKHLQVLMSEQGDIDFQKQVFTLIYEQIGINLSDENRGYEDAEESYFIFVVNGSVGLIQHWLKTGLSKSAQEMANIIYNLAFPIR
jgi:AcrR family transcriptional regulator